MKERLTNREMEIILVDLMLGREPRIKGKLADEFRRKCQKDIDRVKENGGAIEIPFDQTDD